VAESRNNAVKLCREEVFSYFFDLTDTCDLDITSDMKRNTV